jgi:serine/threonine-protein kinase HipA
MVDKVHTAMVKLWGADVGAVSWLTENGYALFEYDPSFLQKGLDIAPLHMGLDAARKGSGLFAFAGLNHDTFLGLPGLLADALPDKFGNRIIETWLVRKGRDPADFSPVERLCYTGRRGMGALEFAPPLHRQFDQPVGVEISALVDLAQSIMTQRSRLDVAFGPSEKQNAEAIVDILRVGTSAGGARPKAVIAINSDGKVISGQADVPEGFDCWVLKFDGVSDLELGDPKGFGRVEYAYHLMAQAAGIEMMPCRLLEENGRAHFLTRRFDRRNGQKIHMQSLCGMAHYDFNRPGAYSYEQAFAVMRRLRLSHAEAIQQYRRMLFNVIARNQDDHTKNIAFLMDRKGCWKLSPAYDVIYAHNPAGQWTNQHQMSINTKRDHFSRADLITVGEGISIPKPRMMLNQVLDAVKQWPGFADRAGVKTAHAQEIARYHRMDLSSG